MELENLTPFEMNELDKLEETVGIYAIVNQYNDMIYIGQSVHIKARLKQHYNSLNKLGSNNALFHDYFVYEKMNFFVTILEVINTQNLSDPEISTLLKEKEAFWIDEFPLEKCYNKSKFQFRHGEIFKQLFPKFMEGDLLDQLEIIVNILKEMKHPISNVDFSDFDLEFKEFMRFLKIIKLIQTIPRISFIKTNDVVIAVAGSDKNHFFSL